MSFRAAEQAPSPPHLPSQRGGAGPSRRRGRRQPDWLWVMVVVLACCALLIAWLIAAPYW